MTNPPLLAEKHIRVKRCRPGVMMYNAADEFVGRSLHLYGEFSEGECDIFRALIGSGAVVLDVGANIGAHTLCFARIVGPTGAVLAFEPQRVLYQMLCGNVALNALTNVVANHLALGSAAGSVPVPQLDYAQPGNFGGVALGELGLSGAASGELVTVVPLDALELPRCDFLKIDVEGMERDVLAGAEATIARFQPILYVENDREDRSPALIAFLLERGYRLYWHCPQLFNPQNHDGEAENVFGGLGSINMLGLPRSSAMVVDSLPQITAPDADWRAATRG
jgi:FkbM family methyltransferase